MRSIATALTRDYVRRSTWPAFFTLLYLIGFPWLAYVLIAWQGVQLPPDVFGSPLPLGVLVVMLIGALTIVWAGQGENCFGMSPRQYALPVQTWFVVGCRMVQCGLTSAALYVVTIATHNTLFGTTWPLAGPALVLAVAGLWIQAVTWSLLNFRLWKLTGLAAIIVSLGYWTGWRFYPDGFYSPPQTWVGPSFREVIELCAYAVAAFAVGLEGVARDRRGDCEGLPAWLARLERWWEALLVHREQRFRSPEDALVWLEWTRRGAAMPIILGGLLLATPLVGAINVALGWARPIDTLEVQLVIALVGLPQLGLVMGMFLGHRGLSGAKLDFDSFSATRPVTDAVLAAVFLRSAWRAVIVSYAVSAAICLATMGWVCWQEGLVALQPLERKVPLLDSPLGWWSIPLVCGASLLATWTSLGLASSLVLAGRMLLMGWVFGGLCGGLVSWLILVNILLPQPVAAIFNAAGCAVFGLACLGGTAWALKRAVGQRLIAANTAWLSLIGWLALCGVIAVVLSLGPAPPNPPPPFLRWLALPLVPGLLALVLAPLATAPLALAWNRHR